MEGNTTGGHCSAQKSLSASQEPGWNDPPKWAYTSKETNTTPAKRLLNKRVAFPLNAKSANPNVSQNLLTDVNIPPLLLKCTTLTTAPHAPLVTPSIMEENHSTRQIDKEQALNNTLENLQIVINKYIESKQKADEVQKRLGIMKSLWTDDKLNSNIHSKVLDISEALKNEDAIKADKIHITLMMERASLCSSWISGIRQIIQKMKEKNGPSNDEAKTESVLYMLSNSTKT